MFSSIRRRNHQRLEVIFRRYFLKQKFKTDLSYALGVGRMASFTAQSLLLPIVDRLVDRNSNRSISKFKDHMQKALPKVKELLRLDAENIGNDLYPSSVLFEESPVKHFFRIPLLVQDAVRANLQRQKKQVAKFDQQDIEFVKSSPKYFQRNFHFQKGGYLSDESATLYDHQVEILFSGTAQAMRRQIIPKMKAHFSGSDGEGLRFLEIASGTGALTRALALAFPKATITCVDASPHYLSLAKKRLKDFKRIDYVNGFGENLNFKDQTFDAVVSCYLFHELPEDVRSSVIEEKWRVLKEGGFLGLSDSIQKDDDPDLNWALKQFPVDFHEPFYKNYSENPIEDVFLNLFRKNPNAEVFFLTKVVWTTK